MHNLSDNLEITGFDISSYDYNEDDTDIIPIWISLNIRFHNCYYDVEYVPNNNEKDDWLWDVSSFSGDSELSESFQDMIEDNYKEEIEKFINQQIEVEKKYLL